MQRFRDNKARQAQSMISNQPKIQPAEVEALRSDPATLNGRTLSPKDLINSSAWFFHSSKPRESISEVMAALPEIAGKVSSEFLNVETTEFEIGGRFRDRNDKSCLNITLREPRISELQNLGSLFFALQYGELIGLHRFDYWLGLRSGFGDLQQGLAEIGGLIGSPTVGIRGEDHIPGHQQVEDVDEMLEYQLLSVAADLVWSQLCEKFT